MVRFRAAICAMVISNEARASFKWSSVAGEFIRTWRIVSLMSATMRSNDGAATLGLSPWLISMRPMRFRFCMASRIERAPHSVALHQLALGRERVAGPQVLCLDDREQPVLDEFSQLWPRHRVPLCSRTCAASALDRPTRQSPTPIGGNFEDPSVPCLLRRQSLQERRATQLKLANAVNWYTMYTSSASSKMGRSVSMGGAR